MPEQYRHLLPSDFDRYDCVKISKVFYFTLIYLLRAYIAWVMSVSNMQDRVGVIEFLYPDPQLFYLNLLSGMLGIFLLFLLSMRRPEAPRWVLWFWPKSREVIVVALCFDLLVSAYGYITLALFSAEYLAIQATVTLLIITFCYRSKRLSLNLAEFPIAIPEK
ncbi:DUF2919 family protein [Thalassotalea atypica]|uniref:DUF2919 family protein n=1 Tax=Thalassotalea atypica TaxID=2054316 RepID=UPI0025736C0C|nr:DUF2919 family protein [Thalassotalea atypica]